MAALNLHHAIFNNEKASHLHLRSASSFLHPAPERDGSPTSHLFTSTAYQDLIQRQPTHPDGPMSGWDLGLNLLGDPISPAEHNNLGEHQTKMKLRRLHAVNIAFELLFGIWGMYTTVRYFLAFVGDSSNTEHVCALVLGIVSALVVSLVVISISMSLHPYAWRHTRSILRACYLLLLSGGAVTNLVLVLIWQPNHFCGWDIDISWYTSALNTVTSPCHPVPSAVWIAAAILRLLVTCTMALSFIYTLRSYHEARHPYSEESSTRYSPYFPTDSEETPPVSPSYPRHLFKPSLKLIQSQDSDCTSNITLPKSNSISTLTPSTSCTGHSRSHSTPPPKYISPLKISPSTPRRTSIHAADHSASTQFRTELPSHTQAVDTVAESSSTSHMLRRSSRISVGKGASDATLLDASSYPERCDGQTIVRDPSEMQSCPSWRPGHRGTGVHSDTKRTTLAWESASVGHASRSNVGPGLSLSTHEGGDPIDEKDRVNDVVYSYGYGASGPTYPYLDMYNPGYAESSLSPCEDVNERGIALGHWRVRATGPSFPDLSSESTSLTREEDDETSSGEEEEYVAMMGGFVRRMATIESLGSKEAAGTLSSATGSVARHSSVGSRTPTSQFSSVRFAAFGSSSCKSSVVLPPSAQGSLSTTYLSFSSGGTGMRVNERGELVPGPHANGSTAGPPCYYTARSGFPRMDDEDR